MTKEVRITVRGTQWDDAGGSGSTEITASGEYYFRNGSHYIFYEERAEDFGGTIKNSIKLKGDLLELNRKGAVNSRMVFETGKSHVTDYATPYGMLRLETVTSRILCVEGEYGMQIKAEYELWADGVRVSQCRLTIRIETTAFRLS